MPAAVRANFGAAGLALRSEGIRLTASPDMALSAVMAHIVGGKSQPGLKQKILNLIPKHLVWIEPFAGLAAITCAHRPAATSIVVDKTRHPELELPPHVKFVRGCGIRFLSDYKWTGKEAVYIDPPYLLSVRGYRQYYPHEMPAEDHAWLLEVIVSIPSPVIISGYRSALYDEKLQSWNREDVQVFNRRNQPRTECLWFNFPRPTELHEYSVVGDDWRERHNIKKRVRRWVAKFVKLPALERAAMLEALQTAHARSHSSPVLASPAAIAGTGEAAGTLAKLG